MNFDPIARVYTLGEFLTAGTLLGRVRACFAGEALAGCRRVLIAGDGPGHGTELALRHAAPDAEIDVVEASAAMIATARSRLNPVPARVTWNHADLRDWRAPPSAYDAVVAQFFLDCFGPAELERVIRLLSAAMAPGAVLLLADFRVPERGWRRWRALWIHAVMHLAFRLAVRLESRRITPPQPLLETAGLVRERRECFCAGLLYAEVWRKPSG